MKAQNSLKGEKSIVGLAVLTHNTIVQGTGVAGGWGGGGWGTRDEKTTSFPNTSDSELLAKLMNFLLPHKNRSRQSAAFLA